jgi:hypothetical protein
MTSPATKKISPTFIFELLKAHGHPGPVATRHQFLEYMRVHFERGAIAALYDALYYLEQIGGEPPGWVLEGALQIIGDRLKTGKPIGDGSSGNERIKYRRQRMHYERWLAYRVVVAEGTPTIDACAEVSKRLKGTYAKGGADAIEKSVKQVTKMLKNPEKHPPYLPMPQSSGLAGTPALKLEGIYFGKN